MHSTADRIIRVLLEQARCTECGRPYHAEDVHVLRQVDQRIWDLAAVCNGCYTLSLIRAVVHAADGEAAEAPVVHVSSELTTSEQRHFAGLPPLEADDVLDVTAFLSSFDGDFRALFGRDSVE